MKTSKRSYLTIFLVTISVKISSAQENNPYKFERPLAVSDYYRSNDGANNNHDFDYQEDQMAVESQVDNIRERIDRIPAPTKTENTKLRKRRIEVRPRVERKTEPTLINNKTPFPEFPNFPQVYEVPSNDNLSLNVTNKNNNFDNQNVNVTETLPMPQPLTMSKSASSSRLKNHNAVRRKIDALPVNLTPGNGGNGKGQSPKFRTSLQPLYDYYDDDYYYYDDYYDEMVEPLPPLKPKRPAFQPISPKKPYQASKPIRKSPPKSENFSKWAKNEKIQRITPPKMSKMPAGKRPSSSNYSLRKRLQNHRPENHRNHHQQKQEPYRQEPMLQRFQENVKSDRFATLPGVTKNYGGLDSSQTKTKTKKKIIEYEYYDEDYDYYDDFYVPAQPRRRSGGGGGINPLALLVAPLAAISLLAAAAAVAVNPVLINVSLTGKRKKRSLNSKTDDKEDPSAWNPELQEKMHELQVLERFLGSIPENNRYQQQILSMYLSCSGYTEPSNKCLDRVVCDYSDSKTVMSIKDEEKDVISIILYNIMANEYVTEDYKNRLRTSARIGRDEGTCKRVFKCTELDDTDNN